MGYREIQSPGVMPATGTVRFVCWSYPPDECDGALSLYYRESGRLVTETLEWRRPVVALWEDRHQTTSREGCFQWSPVVACELGSLYTPWAYATDYLKLSDENFAYFYEPHITGPVSADPRLTGHPPGATPTCPCGCMAEVRPGRDCLGDEINAAASPA